ncbi:hypothetical protein JYU14_04405, partial [Simkania negevensis]|nr:hypothetical protein [Simkania negevensis]
MRTWLKNLAVKHWQKKVVAIIAAIVIWALVNNTITATKTISNIPVNVAGVPHGKTVLGMLSNGEMGARVTLFLKGDKRALGLLSASNLKVEINVVGRGNEFIAQVGRRDLVTTNPNVDILRDVSEVSSVEIPIRLSQIVTEKIPVLIRPPVGTPPKGYLFLDIWPQKLMQTVTGPEEQVNYFKKKGLELTFDLDKVTRTELDMLASEVKGDEVSFPIPHSWKRIPIPFLNDRLEELNDPLAEKLQIYFLHKDFLPIGRDVPVDVFYSVDTSETINPDTYPLSITGPVKKKNGIKVYVNPLYVGSVSHQFLDVVRTNLELVVIAESKTRRDPLLWSLQFVDPKGLENEYVKAILKQMPKQLQDIKEQDRELFLRTRFQSYLREVKLFGADNQRLVLHAVLGPY